MESKIKLKPCPYCGNATIDYWNEADRFMYCESCGMCGPRGRTRDDAAEKWNALPRTKRDDSSLLVAMQKAQKERDWLLTFLEKACPPPPYRNDDDCQSIEWSISCEDCWRNAAKEATCKKK
jgi:Lar family restriction alleviation protein